MIKVSVIGFGNVARHLADAIDSCPKIDLVQVYSRTSGAETFPYSGRIISRLDDLHEADLYIIAVSDVAVREVSESLPFSGKLVVHTAGSLDMEALDGRNRKGVFYPLQTFSKKKAISFRTVPLCLETQFEADYEVLHTVASSLSETIYAIDSSQRKALHVAAVFVSNFTNHLYKLGNDICQEHAVPFEILKPLIAETADKIRTLTPAEAQTGPAIRNDINTIAAHLGLLTQPEQRQLYEIMTTSIQNERKKL